MKFRNKQVISFPIRWDNDIKYDTKCSQRTTKIKTKQKEIISMNSLTKKYMKKIITLRFGFIKERVNKKELTKKS